MASNGKSKNHGAQMSGDFLNGVFDTRAFKPGKYYGRIKLVLPGTSRTMRVATKEGVHDAANKGFVPESAVTNR